MKKLISVLILAMLAVLCLCGCGNDEPIHVVTVEELEAAAAASAEPEEVVVAVEADFEVIDLGDGTCSLRYCSSEAPIVEVPETLYGMTLVSLESFSFNQSPAEMVVLPDTVTYIADYTFVGCDNLKTVQFGAGLESVGEMIFNACLTLETVSFPEGMTTMESLTFGTCANLGEIYVPASVTEIPYGIATLEMCPNIIIVTPEGSVAEDVASEMDLPVAHEFADDASEEVVEEAAVVAE